MTSYLKNWAFDGGSTSTTSRQRTANLLDSIDEVLGPDLRSESGVVKFIATATESDCYTCSSAPTCGTAQESPTTKRVILRRDDNQLVELDDRLNSLWPEGDA